MKKLLAIILASVMILTFAACSNTSDSDVQTDTDSDTQQTADISSLTENKVFIEIEMEDGGVMKAELYPDVAPVTVENFLKLIDSSFFDGLIFHRVIPGFMIQGGGFDADINQKEADSIKGEFSSNGVINELKHTRGVLSMARTSVPDSASSQFFIMVDDADYLDGQYAAFGMVTEGMEIADKIVNLERDSSDMPLDPPVIKTIRRAE